MVYAPILKCLWGVDMNLLIETVEILRENGKTLLDIKWSGTLNDEYECNPQELLDVNYNNRYGRQEIPSNFILVGNDFWLERHEYDGAEWWEYKELPSRPSAKKAIEKL